MLKALEKYWPLISILLTLALLDCLLFWPSVSPPLALVVVVLSIGMAILFSVQKHVRAYRQGMLDRPALTRNIFVDVFGTLMIIVAALLLVGRVAQVVGLAAGRAAESQWPGTGALLGMLAGLLAGLPIGIGIALLVQMTWGRLVKHPRAVGVENEA